MLHIFASMRHIPVSWQLIPDTMLHKSAIYTAFPCHHTAYVCHYWIISLPFLRPFPANIGTYFCQFPVKTFPLGNGKIRKCNTFASLFLGCHRQPGTFSAVPADAAQDTAYPCGLPYRGCSPNTPVFCIQKILLLFCAADAKNRKSRNFSRLFFLILSFHLPNI